jgi:tetratricopeptide (TPR) repeat protein
VFWVHASNTARLEQSFWEIADQVKIRGRKDPQANVFKLVHDWLRDAKHGRWLLVLDNADDAGVLSPLPINTQTSPADNGGTGSSSSSALQQRLSTYLPPSTHGSVIVTSRTRCAAIQVVEDSDVIPIEPMRDAAAHLLLYKKLGDKVNISNGIAELAAALEYMPLALVQAASYIRERAPRCSVRQYLAEYRKSDRRKTRLLNQAAGHLRRDEAASNSILLTWQISFDHIRNTRQSAADLLSLMSFFDRQEIPETLLRVQDGETVCDGVAPASFDDEFEGDISTLRDYSLVTVAADERTFEMHSLVQLATREWLQGHNQAIVWLKAALEVLAAAFPNGQPETWTTCRILFPHTTKVLSHAINTDNKARLDRATIATNAAWYLMLTGEYANAERNARIALTARQEVLGREHKDTFISISRLGSVLERQGQYAEAEVMYRRALQGFEMVLGQEHPYTLLGVNNLGSALWNQGKYKEAEAMHRQALYASERVLGLEHQDTIRSVDELGSVLERQGKYADAEAMHRRALKGYEDALGREHPDTLTSISQLGSALQSQGKYEEAQAMYRRVLEGSEKVFGRRHPDTILIVNDLGILLERQGKYGEAEAMHRRALQEYENALGQEHPYTLSSVNNMGSVLSRQGKYAEAVAMHQRALEGRKKVLGPEHPHTLISAKWLRQTRLEWFFDRFAKQCGQ